MANQTRSCSGNDLDPRLHLVQLHINLHRHTGVDFADFSAEFCVSDARTVRPSTVGRNTDGLKCPYAVEQKMDSPKLLAGQFPASKSLLPLFRGLAPSFETNG
jgi:hypothetical protein